MLTEYIRVLSYNKPDLAKTYSRLLTIHPENKKAIIRSIESHILPKKKEPEEEVAVFKEEEKLEPAPMRKKVIKLPPLFDVGNVDSYRVYPDFKYDYVYKKDGIICGVVNGIEYQILIEKVSSKIGGHHSPQQVVGGGNIHETYIADYIKIIETKYPKLTKRANGIADHARMKLRDVSGDLSLDGLTREQKETRYNSMARAVTSQYRKEIWGLIEGIL